VVSVPALPGLPASPVKAAGWPLAVPLSLAAEAFRIAALAVRGTVFYSAGALALGIRDGRLSALR
jgi:hypothetical protein